jgi:hypothetical protein
LYSIYRTGKIVHQNLSFCILTGNSCIETLGLQLTDLFACNTIFDENARKTFMEALRLCCEITPVTAHPVSSSSPHTSPVPPLAIQQNYSICQLMVDVKVPLKVKRSPVNSPISLNRGPFGSTTGGSLGNLSVVSMMGSPVPVGDSFVAVLFTFPLESISDRGLHGQSSGSYAL